MFFVSFFFHVICKISNFNVWTAEHLAQASCTELTLIMNFHDFLNEKNVSCLMGFGLFVSLFGVYFSFSTLKYWYSILDFPPKGAQNYPEDYPLKEEMLRIVIWQLFWEIWAKVKNFLRLNHLWYYERPCTYKNSHFISHKWKSLMTGMTWWWWSGKPRRALEWSTYWAVWWFEIF